MKKFAQVLRGKLHWKFERWSAPEFSSGIVIIDITGVTPEPQEGWMWDGSQFVSPAIPSASQLLDFAKAAALNAVESLHSETIRRLAGSPTQSEKDTWALKVATATAILNNEPISAAGAAFLQSAELTLDDEKVVWSMAVLEKSAAYATAVGIAEKLRYTGRLAVQAALSEASLSEALAAHRAAVRAELDKGQNKDF